MEVIGHYPNLNALEFLQKFRRPEQPTWLVSAAESTLRQAFMSAIKDISLNSLLFKRMSAGIILEIDASRDNLPEGPSPVPALPNLVFGGTSVV